MQRNLQIQLASIPDGIPEPHHFQTAAVPVPEVSDGQVLCQTLYLSLDPYMRSQIAGRYITEPIRPGDLMQGETISQVVTSASPNYAAGDIVRCQGNWQQYSIHQAAQLAPLPKTIERVSLGLSALGMPGLTAYAGLNWLTNLKPDDVVVIPAATGAVGSVVGQLAKLHGCTVVGIAGSDEKCRYAIEKLGYDACINRKTEDLATKLDEHCPNRVDVYFDLVGGETLNLVCTKLAIGARVILCGLMADYNGKTPTPGPLPGPLISARATVHGLIVYDFEDRRDEFIDAVLPYIKDGRLIVQEDMTQGIESAPKAFCKLMRGDNKGKTIVKVHE